jgi:hypothetical protein
MQSAEGPTRTSAGPVAEIDRRSLFKGAAAVGAASFLGPFGRSAAMAAETSDWVWAPMRWVQINFTEDDPGRFDPKFWLDFMRRTKTDGVCLGAGGIVAFYPTKVPFHYRSPYLGDADCPSSEHSAQLAA